MLLATTAQSLMLRRSLWWPVVVGRYPAPKMWPIWLEGHCMFERVGFEDGVKKRRSNISLGA